jgi:heme-degrading monooxygenase HmoA
MYARSTTVHGNPAALEVGIAYVREAVIPAVRDMDGCVGLSMLADRESGHCIITTAWADAEAMRRSAENVRGIRDRTAEILVGAAEVQEWEIAILHRMYETRDHACARVTWTQCDPAQLDQMIETFRMSLLPRMEELPGFCSVSLMVDRESGTCATAVTYESHEAMEASKKQGMALRKEFSDAMAMQVTDVAGFDLVLAHLRVPETV